MSGLDASEKRLVSCFPLKDKLIVTCPHPIGHPMPIPPPTYISSQFRLFPRSSAEAMAPALTSNSFRVTAGAYSRPEPRPSLRPAGIIYAKQNEEGSSKGKKLFSFDFGQLPDPKSLIPAVSSPAGAMFANRLRRKDPRTVFVAGATGQAGIRIAQKLLRQGFAVRAGVPDLAAAQELARLAAAYKIISPEESKRLNAVDSTFTDAETIARSIGPATKVVVTIGPAENGPAAAVTTDDALEVVRAAQLAGATHVAVVYDSSSGPSQRTSSSGGSSAASDVLNDITSFFSNLFSPSQSLTISEFLSKVAETDVAFTLIKAALTDEESAYPLVLSKEGATGVAGGGATDESKVSKSQIASLIADVFSNTSVAENKVVEVSTNPSASSKPIAELFSAIPEDGRRKANAEAVAKAKAAEEAVTASERAREAAEAAKNLEEEVKKLSEQKALAASFAEEAQERAAAAGSSLDSLLKRAKNIGAELSLGKLGSQIATAVSQKPNGEPRVQLATVRGQAKAMNLLPRKAVVKQPAPRTKSKEAEPKPEIRKVFGGLFKQEVIYMDD